MKDVRRSQALAPRGLVVLVSLAFGACAAPMTRTGPVSPEQVAAEQQRQMQFTVEQFMKQQQRAHGIAYPMLRSAVGLCPQEHVGFQMGVSAANAYVFTKDWQPAARALGFGDTLTVSSVAPGSAAEHAGVQVADRIVAANGEAVPTGPKAVRAYGQAARRGVEAAANAGRAPEAELDVVRGGVTQHLNVPLDTVCNYQVAVVQNEEVNAFADGHTVYITSAMMRFAADDDELATVIGHELAHNAMKHIQAKKRNAGIGALFGALADIAMASQGINTGGYYTSEFAKLGAMTFSQDFEREADYVGVYIIARSGRPLTAAPLLWRQMAAVSPGSIRFASSHPTTAERYVRLDRYIQEIEQKRAAKQPLVPEMRK